MRIVILSEPWPAIEALDRVARAEGHETVALIRPRAVEERHRAYEEKVVASLPAHLALCLIDGPGEIATLLQAFDADLGLCLGYSWRLPPAALTAPLLGVVNAHPSLLPRHRGPSPLAWQLLEGDEQVGMTLHFMDEDFDTGPVLAQSSRPMPDEVWSMRDVSAVYVELVEELLPGVLARVQAGERGTPQNGGGTYAGPLGEAQARIDVTRTALEAHRLVQAWSVVRGADGPYVELGGRRHRVVRTSLSARKGARRLECADAPLWILESEPV